MNFDRNKSQIRNTSQDWQDKLSKKVISLDLKTIFVFIESKNY